jgi:hypothetical protein
VCVNYCKSKGLASFVEKSEKLKMTTFSGSVGGTKTFKNYLRCTPSESSTISKVFLNLKRPNFISSYLSYFILVSCI